MKFKHIVVVLSILGTVVLYFLTTLSQPLPIPLSEVSLHEGKQVVVEGIVISHYQTRTGRQIITIQDQNSTDEDVTVVLFLEEAKTVEYGDRIQATGKIQKYKNDWEIVIDNPQAVSIIQKWSNITVPLWQLSATPQRYVGLNITVSGVGEWVEGSYFTLGCEENEYVLLVVCGASVAEEVSLDAPVSVFGTFTYEASNFRYVFTAVDVKSLSNLPSNEG